jgi:hypothetical protein
MRFKSIEGVEGIVVERVENIERNRHPPNIGDSKPTPLSDPCGLTQRE